MNQATIKKLEELISDAKGIDQEWQAERWTLRAHAFLGTALGAGEAAYFTSLGGGNPYDAIALQIGRLEGLLATAAEESKNPHTPASSERPFHQEIDVIKLLCLKFQIVTTQLRNRRENRPTLEVSDEYDVQDLFHALLRIFFDDVRPEDWTPNYAGKSSRMDFLLPAEQLVIEVKKTREGLGAKEVGSQLIEDIARYKKHPSCKRLICFVYDPERCVANPRGIENDLNGNESGLEVQVLIAPRG